MTTLATTLAWLLAEINVVLLVFVGWGLFSYLRGKRRATAAVVSLVKTVKENEPAQLETLSAELKDHYGRDETNAAETAKTLLKLKKSFYKKLIHIYMDKYSEAFRTLDEQLDELLMSYRKQMPLADETATPAPAGDAVPSQQAGSLAEKTDTMSADIETLKRQNDQLKHDLDQAKKELESTITEYISAYSGSVELGKAKLETELQKIKHNPTRGILEEDGRRPPATPVADEDDADEHAAESPEQAADDAKPDEAANTVALDDGLLAQDEGKADDSEDVLSLSDVLNSDGLTVEEIDSAELETETASES